MPNENRIEGKFMKNILGKAIPAGIVSAMIVFAAMFLGRALGVSEEEMSTMCTLVFGAVSMIYLYRICLPMNVYRAIVYTGCIIGLTICFWWIGPLFSLTKLSATSLFICLGLGVLAYPMLLSMPRLMENRLDRFIARIENKYQR